MANDPSFIGWPGLLTRLLAGDDLGADVAGSAITEILRGDATPSQMTAFVVAMRAKGETAGELEGMLHAVRTAGNRVNLPADVAARAVDIVGTGGDKSYSVNVSTMAALVVAGAGVPVCKHGNRAASSNCGAADVLEAAGIAVELDPAGVEECVTETGFGFCLASRFHPAFRHAGQSRGVTSAWVVHGHGGLDELAVSGPNTVFALRDGQVEKFEIDAKDHGIARSGIEDVRGGEVAENLAALRSLLEGKKGPVRDIVVFNAACAMHVAGLVSDIADGIDRACASIDSGAARDVLERAVEVSRRAAARAGQ